MKAYHGDRELLPLSTLEMDEILADEKRRTASGYPLYFDELRRVWPAVESGSIRWDDTR